ncbi:hypothetical protein DASC09_057180 [Saccharomycopsis crataegensis]|uniref:Mmc1 C-terminal domain-containing protein n=1 Tax=Saccharomycopsis crataegensis TaxID=43959 RepID=A0AAV5QUH4_9ASCO|nr:hypothetical protein DASC09_057180 [Saccharomycopsis crataegensis]
MLQLPRALATGATQKSIWKIASCKLNVYSYRCLSTLESDLIKGIKHQEITTPPDNNTHKEEYLKDKIAPASDIKEREALLDSLIQDLRDINTRFLTSVSSRSPTNGSIGGAIDNETLSKKVNLLILHLKSISRGQPYPIRIGIKKAPGNSNSLLPALLGDPLSGNQDWYSKLKQRSNKGNHLVAYRAPEEFPTWNDNSDNKPFSVIVENVAHDRTLSFWEIQTPLLSSTLRLGNFKNLQQAFGGTNADRLVASSSPSSSPKNILRLNDLELLEINTANVGNCNILPLTISRKEDEDILYESYIPLPDIEDENLDIGDGCHLYVYHTVKDTQYPMEEVFPYFLVVDSAQKSMPDGPININEEGLFSEDGTPIVLRIDSKMAQQANELLMSDFSQSSQYVASLKSSNLLKLLYLLNTATAGEKNVLDLLKIINKIITVRFFYSATTALEESELLALQNTVREEVRQWARASNSFLQRGFRNALEEYEKRQLVWWKLPWIADDLEFYMIEMIHQAMRSQKGRNNFMEKLSYVEGKIDSHLIPAPISGELNSNPLVKDANDGRNSGSIDQFMDTLAPDIINIQNATIKTLTTQLLGVYTPATLLSVLGGYALYGFDVYAVGGVVALATAIVCNNISKHWESSMRGFKSKVVELLRKEIREEEAYLHTKWDVVYTKREKLIRENVGLVEKFRENIEALEKIENGQK